MKLFLLFISSFLFNSTWNFNININSNKNLFTYSDYILYIPILFLSWFKIFWYSRSYPKSTFQMSTSYNPVFLFKTIQFISNIYIYIYINSVFFYSIIYIYTISTENTVGTIYYFLYFLIVYSAITILLYKYLYMDHYIILFILDFVFLCV